MDFAYKADFMMVSDIYGSKITFKTALSNEIKHNWKKLDENLYVDRGGNLYLITDRYSSVSEEQTFIDFSAVESIMDLSIRNMGSSEINMDEIAAELFCGV